MIIHRNFTIPIIGLIKIMARRPKKISFSLLWLNEPPSRIHQLVCNKEFPQTDNCVLIFLYRFHYFYTLHGQKVITIDFSKSFDRVHLTHPRLFQPLFGLFQHLLDIELHYSLLVWTTLFVAFHPLFS